MSRLGSWIALAAMVATSGCVSIRIGPGGPEPLVESVVSGETGPKILLLEVDGVISAESEAGSLLGRGRESMVARVKEQLDRARDDDAIQALLLRINSPGGTATASDILHREIAAFKRDREVPVVAQLMGLATSGGYYVAMAADAVYAEPTTVTGSIGVIFLGLDLSGLMDKLGVEDQTLTAGRSKDAGSWLRPMRPEERAHLQSILDDLHARFQQTVVAGRPELDAEAVARLADGRIYSADQALANGLVDALGGLDETIAETERRAGLESARVVTYHRPKEWKQNVYTRSAASREPRLELLPQLPRLPRPGFFYLWAPGAR